MSLIGKLFGGGEKTTKNEVDYVKLVENAEKAGFNPLTALRNGGAAGFTATTTPALSSGEVIGEAANTLGSFLQNFDPYADERREAEFGTANAQIHKLNEQPGKTGLDRPGTMNVPAYTAGNVERRPSGTAAQLSNKPLPATAAMPATPEVVAPQFTNPNSLSSGRLVDPDKPNVSSYEERYGDSEILNTLFGVKRLADDLIYDSFAKTKAEIDAAKKRRAEAIERKRTGREELRKNEAFFKRHGY